jgi:hypothetical protein
MAAEKNIQIKQHNGIDWDSLFPKTKASIVMLNDGSTVESKIASILSTLASKVEQSDINTAIANLVDSSPSTLDTLNELAAALNDDPNFATTITNQLSNKVDKVAGKGLSTNDFTTALLNKLNGLPSSVYSKTEVDNLITSAGTGIVVSPDEPEDASMWFEELN